MLARTEIAVHCPACDYMMAACSPFATKFKPSIECVNSLCEHYGKPFTYHSLVRLVSIEALAAVNHDGVDACARSLSGPIPSSDPVNQA